MSASYERDEQSESRRWMIGVTAGLIAIAAAVAGAWLYFQREPAPAPAPPPPVAQVPAAPPAAAPEPQIKFPIEQAQAPAAEKGAPALSVQDSDPAAREALAKLVGQQRVAQLFQVDGIVRRWVATVDNLPRERAAQGMMPVKPVAGAFIVSGSGDDMTINPQNSVRYTAWVQLAESVNTNALVAAYVRLYPLFQDAYKELGYPKGYFNDRLIEAIDNALGAPDVPAPVALVQPRVVYQFADAKLESLSAGQKIMVRMGSQNAARIKAKLVEVRAALTGKGLR